MDDGLSFADQVALAVAALQLRQERRGGFLSDDDVVDAAQSFVPAFDYDLDTDEFEAQPAYQQFVTLRDTLLALVGT